MSKKLRRVLLIVGVAILLASVVMFAYTRFSITDNIDGSAKIVSKLNSLMPDKTNGYPSDKLDYSMPVIELDGVDFAGLIEVPAYGSVLPICNKWDSVEVSKYPHRFSGSVYNSSLVIGGSDNKGQFDFMKAVSVGDSVSVTDCIGAVFNYVVERIEITKDVSADNLNNTGYALVFFARNTYSLDYTIVMCNLK